MYDKKILIGGAAVGVIILGILLFVFSGNQKTTCTLTSDQSKNGYKLETKYEIISKNDIVKEVKIKETVTSKDEKVLEKFEKQLKEQYEYNNKTYKGYTYKVSKSNDKVTTDVTINYNEFNLEKFIKNNEAMKQYTKDNKFTLKGAKQLYERTGATCK